MKLRSFAYSALVIAVAVPPLTALAGHRGGGRTSAAAAGPSGNSSQTLICEAADSPSSSTPTPSPSSSPTASTGYVIAVSNDQTAEGVMAAVIYYQTPPTGRTPIAGFADVTKVTPSDAATALELKSTDQSPYRFDLTVEGATAAVSASATSTGTATAVASANSANPGVANHSGGWRAATLITADLFSDGTLSSLSYRCRVQRP